MSAKRTSPRAAVFFSYSSHDADAARQIRAALSKHDLRTFAHDDLNAGEKWEERLRTEIKNADLVVAFITPYALASGLVLQELGAAWALSKPIVAIESQRDLLPLPVPYYSSIPAEVDDLENPASVDRLLSEIEQALAVSNPRINRRAS